VGEKVFEELCEEVIEQGFYQGVWVEMRLMGLVMMLDELLAIRPSIHQL
jgi:hypothetical protein